MPLKEKNGTRDKTRTQSNKLLCALKTMLSNSEQEEIWVNGWNDLYDLIPKYPNGFILINDCEEVTVEEAQGWMQDAAYNSNKIIFTTEYYKGKKSILLKQESI